MSKTGRQPTTLVPEADRGLASRGLRGANGDGPVRRDRAFALRLQKACDDNPRVPGYNRGRQAWVRSQLVERFGMNVSNETVSKWFTGVARPRPEKISVIAQLLEVDEAWLVLGVGNEVEPREVRIRNALADGAVNVVAGFIQMCGGHPAFPEADDARARGGAPVDLYAIIKGTHYPIHVVVAQAADGAFRCNVPYEHAERVVLAVVQREALLCDFLELTGDMIEAHGVRRSGFIEVRLTPTAGGYETDGAVWPRISTFADGL